MSFNNRSNALIELLEELTQPGHEYVLVGGYAVSAFNARFSTDLAQGIIGAGLVVGGRRFLR